MIQKILSIVQIIVAVLLMTAILLQGRGTGLSSVFGGEGGVYQTRRGIEKFLFIFTIILACVFFGLSLVNLFI